MIVLLIQDIYIKRQTLQSKEKKMNRIELLAPAKDLQKAKTAIRYGADAVYIGGKRFSLRSRASNFDIEDIREIVGFAHERGKKIYVTVNIIFHDEDFYGIKEYLKELETIGVDAIIVESFAVVKLAKKIAPKMECHISTQASTCNSFTVEEMAKWGADRVVLAREVDMDQIEMVAKRTDVQLEVFIHGGMCSNYSGHCTLSNRMTLRDANRGGCAQSCRWKYRVYDEGTLISDEACPLSMSSKDLRATSYVERMIKANVASLKIEGRMKSDYYIAQIVKTYRKMIDEVYAKGHLDEERIAYYDAELSKAENRLSDDGFLSGTCDDTKHLYGINGAGVTHEFVAYVKDYDEKTMMATIEVRNKFNKGEELEVFGPTIDNERFVVTEMYNQDYESIDVANQPMEVLSIKVPFKVELHDMIRKVFKDDNRRGN